jgi:hypothetical protein
VEKVKSVFAFIVLNLSFSAASELSQNNLIQSELHWSVCGNSSREIIRKIGLEIDKTEARSLTFYDLKNPDGDFKFFSQGIVLRLRSDVENSASSTIKIKVKSPSDFLEHNTLANNEKYKCEEDRYRDKLSYFCSLTRDFRIPNELLFSENQKYFLSQIYAEDFNQEKLSPYGPVSNHVWVFSRSKGFVLEEIRLPDLTSFYEISLRVSAVEAEKKYQEYSEFLKKKNIHLCEVQESKTLKVLNYFQNL